ncbi:MAG: amino acid transporter permease [Rhodospirillales bacterium]|nr:amino acid transporter permease [Rhodospirillales bacterium]
MSAASDPDRRFGGAAAPKRVGGAARWLRENLFSSMANSILTIIAVIAILWIVVPLARWAVLDAVWTAASGRECRAAIDAGGGACWAFIGVWWRSILFGRFPYAEQWRPALVVAIFVAMFLASCDRRLWGRRLIALWILGAALVLLLMFGGVLGMSFVDTSLWNGLPLTLILAVFGMLFAFPLAILLALGRRSEMPAVRALSVAYIELIRGVPLITILFMASVMLPLFLPSGTSIDKLLRAQIAFILFSAAYLAEVIRGGLQSLPRGQSEAADALGLSPWQRTRLIVLPQAIAAVIPPLVNTFIGAFKDTSLVLIIGLFDLMMTATNALGDPNWNGFYWEAYLFVGAIYWAFCFFMSKYSQFLERDFNRAHRR